MSEEYQYASYELKVRMTIRQGPEPAPNAVHKITDIWNISEQYGFALIDEENEHEYIEYMTGLFFNAMMAVTKLDDCTVGATIRDAANELIPEGC